VTPLSVRVYGDNEDEVYGCHDCLSATEMTAANHWENARDDTTPIARCRTGGEEVPLQAVNDFQTATGQTEPFAGRRPGKVRPRLFSNSPPTLTGGAIPMFIERPVVLYPWPNFQLNANS
jgi:hypothetical protein